MTTMDDFHAEARFERPTHTVSEPHLAVQILAIIAFGTFSIVAVSLAFSASWIAGFIVATTVAWAWSESRAFQGGKHEAPSKTREIVREVVPAMQPRRSSGSASFDAYRSDVLERLEREQEDFEGFLDRLREARDKSEFDHFMDERVAAARELRDTEPQDQR
jgi:hypothetical protein